MKEIAPGVACVATSFVNAYLVGEPGCPWVLIDTGLRGFGRKVRAAAEDRFGRGAWPEAILLTHGHFDHAGNARELADYWQAPVYAHPLELPYLTGHSDYPPPDPTIGGCIATLSRVLPYSGRDLGTRLRALPPDKGASAAGAQSGPAPGPPGWRWIFTPGHSPGHVAFYNEQHGILIAGDAVATVNMDSYIGMITKRQELARSGSPFVSDWLQARRSVEVLASLAPWMIACGHGIPMAGGDVASDFERFANHFPAASRGRYVDHPAIADERGVDYIPPAPADPFPFIAGAAVAGLLLAIALRPSRNR